MKFALQRDYENQLSLFLERSRVERQVSEWVSAELSRIGNPEVANRFHQHFDKFPVQPIDYAPRLFRVGDCNVLGGIRFYGGDSNRAFVDITGWMGELDFEDLRVHVKKEWEVFSPFALVLLKPADMVISGAETDLKVYIQNVSTMSADEGAVTLGAVDDIAVAHDLVVKRYDAIDRDDPVLGRSLFPASQAELRQCYELGTLDYIYCNGKRAGLIATLPDKIAFVSGHLIMEEIIVPEFRGKGLAVSAQRALAAKVCNDDPNGLLIGVIDGKNIASQKTAERAGRVFVFEYVFLPL